MNIPLTKPYFDKNEEKAILSVLRSGWVTQGPQVLNLEKLIENYTDVKYAVATTSATTALYLSLILLGIEKGDEVILPSFTFIANANVIVSLGAKPIFIDIDPRTFNIDYKKIEEKITKKTKAILFIDQIGLPADLDEIKKIAKKHNLKILEDAACALGSSYKGKKIGGLSDVSVFSLHPRKVITSGEGGIITTNNQAFAKRARILRHHGMAVSDLVRHSSKKVIHETYSEIGFNFRMSDLEAAVGVEQMKKIDRFLKKRNILANRYNKIFSKNELISLPFIADDRTHNYQSFIIRLKKNKFLSRDKLMQKLLDKGISTRRGVMAIHLEKPYIKLFGKISLPETETATNETLCIPIYYQLSNSEQDYVISNILNILNKI